MEPWRADGRSKWRRGGLKWRPGGSVGQRLQIRITLMRSRIRIRIEVNETGSTKDQSIYLRTEQIGLLLGPSSKENIKI
jgi:hypothetical protein